MGNIIVQDTSGNHIKTLPVDLGKTLLAQLEAADIEVPNACKTGICAACMCHIMRGEEHVVKNFRGEPAFPLGDDEVMTCIAKTRETEDDVVLQLM